MLFLVTLFVVKQQFIDSIIHSMSLQGHDTTAAAISWAIYCLGKYPQEQEIVYNEISELLRDSGEVTW